LDTQAFSASGADVDGLEFAAFDTLQQGLAGDAVGEGGLERGQPAFGCVVDEQGADVVGEADSPGGAGGRSLVVGATPGLTWDPREGHIELIAGRPGAARCAGQLTGPRPRSSRVSRPPFEAKQLAGIEPTFTAYDGDDPAGYALAVNIARRHLSAPVDRDAAIRLLCEILRGTVPLPGAACRARPRAVRWESANAMTCRSTDPEFRFSEREEEDGGPGPSCR
jgi:hypothetical protein